MSVEYREPHEGELPRVQFGAAGNSSTKDTAMNIMRTTALVSLFSLTIGCANSQRIPPVAAPAKVGDVAPNFTVKSLLPEQADFTLAEHQGETVVLAFWWTPCSACVEDGPTLTKLAEWANESNVPLQIARVHNDLSYHPTLKRTMPSPDPTAKRPNNYGLYAEGINDNFEDVYGVRSWPYILVINADGIITHIKTTSRFRLLEELQDEITKATQSSS